MKKEITKEQEKRLIEMFRKLSKENQEKLLKALEFNIRTLWKK